MEYAYLLNGAGAPLKMGFQVNATMANAGIPVLAPGAGNAGVQLSTTTSWANAVGVTLSTATFVTAQQTDGTSAEREVDVIISPQAVFRALMSGGAADGTALTLFDVTTASATGLAITTGDNWTVPQFDEGVVWGYDGANAGAKRKITSTSTTAATVTVAFDQDTVVGDNFLRCPYNPGQTETLQLTTALDQADASIAVGTGGTWNTVELLLLDIGGNGRTNSYVFAKFQDHEFAHTT